jgi:hypothetical protein
MNHISGGGGHISISGGGHISISSGGYISNSVNLRLRWWWW